MKINVNGVNYLYQWYRPYLADLPTLVVLHGFTGTSDSFRPVFAQETSFNVLAIDLLGHGGSASHVHPLRYEMIQMVTDLAELVDRLTVDRYYLYGYSMGARTALAWTVAFPDKIAGLIMESGSPGLESESARSLRRRNDQRLAIRLIQQPLVDFVDYWQELPLFASQKRLPKEIQQQVRATRLSQQAFGLAMSLYYSGTGTQPSFWQNLADIQCPFLVLTGEWDEKFFLIAKKMQQQQPALTILSVSKAGHCVHLECPDVVANEVHAWLTAN